MDYPDAEHSSTASSHVPNKARLRDTWDPRKGAREAYDLQPHPETGRLIDNHPGTRTKPMRVMCLGLSRTGTISIFTALKRLGYTPYHMAVAIAAPRSNLEPWTEGLQAKHFGQGKRFGKPEFDKILGNYDSFLDIPALCFTEELIEAYPDAKVILHTRDIDAWCKSMDDTVGRACRWNWRWIAPWDPGMAKPWYDNLTATMPGWMGMSIDNVSFYSTEARESFNKQYELVRRIVPKDRLLEYKVQDGWQPLCEFLDLDTPDEDFPKGNDSDEFIANHKAMWWKAVSNLARTLTITIALPMFGVAMAAWWQLKR